MKKKGFTLIELLAVIVILAIIALIATPIVMNVIDNARKGAAERSAENYISAVETAVMEERMEDGTILEGKYNIDGNGNLTGNGLTEPLKIDVNGNKPTGGTVIIENGKVVPSLSSDATKKTTLSMGSEYTVSYDANKKSYVATENTTTIVYSWSETTVATGSELTSYTTDPTTLGKDVYLKHILDSDNKVTKSYACVYVGAKDEEVCFSDSYSDATENQLALEKFGGLFDGDEYCPPGDGTSYGCEGGRWTAWNNYGRWEMTNRADNYTCYANTNEETARCTYN